MRRKMTTRKIVNKAIVQAIKEHTRFGNQIDWNTLSTDVQYDIECDSDYKGKSSTYPLSKLRKILSKLKKNYRRKK